MLDMRKGVCPLCEHDEIIAARPAEFGDGGHEVPAAVTYDPRMLFPGRNPNTPYGKLVMYVCRGCGFTQTFAQEPETIPISDEHKTRLVKKKKPEKGYR
jgi:hypothetical protein